MQQRRQLETGESRLPGLPDQGAACVHVSAQQRSVTTLSSDADRCCRQQEDWQHGDGVRLHFHQRPVGVGLLAVGGLAAHPQHRARGGACGSAGDSSDRNFAAPTLSKANAAAWIGGQPAAEPRVGAVDVDRDRQLRRAAAVGRAARELARLHAGVRLRDACSI